MLTLAAVNQADSATACRWFRNIEYRRPECIVSDSSHQRTKKIEAQNYVFRIESYKLGRLFSRFSHLALRQSFDTKFEESLGYHMRNHKLATERGRTEFSHCIGSSL